MNNETGGFTLPGEAGYEGLTLELARRWGADVIRDSDGTALSPELLNSGLGIYSTICIIREHNEFAKANPETLQQTFLSTPWVTADKSSVEIGVMDSFFHEQFAVNSSLEAMKYWQLWDRTADKLIEADQWSYCAETERVTLKNAELWHEYSVSFLAYRIWEEISMYNHTTNNWDKEHLMQLDPAHPIVQSYMLEWLESWCREHPDTTVVRFTSLFYNFVWIWGSDERNRHLFTDWASYDFTVSPLLLDAFENRFGYAMTAEDFINKGLLRSTHSVPDRHKRDWMEFTGDFVASFGRKLVDMVHGYGKKAYVFYDDSWVGLEPYNGKFGRMDFDGLIKCVFSGFEVRLCAGVDVPVHELRLHPYLFPVGLGGAPTFMEGGDPAMDAKKYWVSVRRALLRTPVDRLGLGGYLHLVENFPDFVDTIEEILGEFRQIRALHAEGKPESIGPKVGILTAWGKLRSWTLSGHFHETDSHVLIHIIEALSGVPLDVEFFSFDDIKDGVPEDIDLIINAGQEGDAWSGGSLWAEDDIVDALTEWAYQGGVFVGAGEPSALNGYGRRLRMGHVLGVDIDKGQLDCHGAWSFDTELPSGLWPEGACLPYKAGVRLTDGRARVYASKENEPLLTVHDFGKGKGVYLSGFETSHPNNRLLLNLILHTAGYSANTDYLTDNPWCECAYYPAQSRLVVINNSGEEQLTAVSGEEISLKPFETRVIEV